ncbi:MAG: hypothetical protein ACWGQW_00340 [bacterium]
MRTGATQSYLIADPLIQVIVASQIYYTEGGGGDERIKSVSTDELAFGGEYTIRLNNDDDALNGISFKGEILKMYFGFVGQELSEMPWLTVDDQFEVTDDGVKEVELHCIDFWTRLSFYTANLGGSLWNHPAQSLTYLNTVTLPVTGKPIPSEMKTAINSQYDIEIQNIIDKVLSDTLGSLLLEEEGHSDYSYYNTKPPVNADDARSVVAQALTNCESFIRLRQNYFSVTNPSNSLVVYYFSLNDQYYGFIDAEALVRPNKIVLYGADSGGSLINTETPHGENAESMGKIGVVAVHDYTGWKEIMGVSTQAELDNNADAKMGRLESSLDRGYFTAPMHCSLELFDKIEVTDDRYDIPKTVQGIVFRIQRKYSRGEYTISIQLGGVESGYTPPNGLGVNMLYGRADIPIKGGGLGTMTRYNGSTTDNWYSGVATSGETGEDLVTIGANDENNMIGSLWLSINNLGTSRIWVRMYQQINGTEREVYKQDFNTFDDPDGLWVVNGQLVISEALRVEVQSEDSGDTSKQIDWEYVILS